MPSHIAESHQAVARDAYQVSAIAIYTEEYQRMRERLARRLWREHQQTLAELRGRTRNTPSVGD